MNRFLLLFTFLSTFLFSAKAQTVIHSETFTTGTITWTAFDEAGTTDKWATTAGYAQINGFQDEDDIDWLISPTINMNNATNETFAFKTKNRFSGVATGPAPNFNLELKYTTNYTGNPTTTTWTTLTLPSTFYLKSDGTSNNNTSSTISAQTVHLPFDISAISGTNVRFAFRYYGTAAASKDWQIDDIEIAGATPCIAPTTQTTALVGTPSTTAANVTWTAGNGNKTLVLINTTNSFTDPVNGTAYTATSTYSGSGQQVIYNGNGTSMTVSGLTVSTQYYIQAYTVSDCASPVTYITTTPSFDDFITNANAGGGEPVGYYNAAASLTCAAKKNALQTIITSPTGSYTSLWKSYETTDTRLNDAGTKTIVYDMYTDIPNATGECEFTFVVDQDGGSGGAAECQKFNREHSFPKSWFGGSTSTGSPGTDLFHVYPTDKKVNNVRGNQPYGEVGTVSYNAANGSKHGTSKILGISGDVFEPIDAYKGDFARTYFYMATRYGSLIKDWASSSVESGTVLSGNSWPAYKPVFLQMLIKWHTNDPVSPKEIARNNAVYGIQGNRNPYIDHPEYVGEVWGVCGSIPVTLKSFTGSYANKAVRLNWGVENEYAFDHYEVEKSADGAKFATIQTVKAQKLRDYAAEDALSEVKINRLYYRLKMVDQDGSVNYSRVVSVELPNAKSGLLFYPNPANTNISIKTTDDATTSFDVTITDIVGKIWLQKNVSTTLGNANNVDISTLPVGNYILTTNVKGFVEYHRLTVVR